MFIYNKGFASYIKIIILNDFSWAMSRKSLKITTSPTVNFKEEKLNLNQYK